MVTPGTNTVTWRNSRIIDEGRSIRLGIARDPIEISRIMIAIVPRPGAAKLKPT